MSSPFSLKQEQLEQEQLEQEQFEQEQFERGHGVKRSVRAKVPHSI
jgi:hypothetical protein